MKMLFVSCILSLKAISFQKANNGSFVVEHSNPFLTPNHWEIN